MGFCDAVKNFALVVEAANGSCGVVQITKFFAGLCVINEILTHMSTSAHAGTATYGTEVIKLHAGDGVYLSSKVAVCSYFREALALPDHELMNQLRVDESTVLWTTRQLFHVVVQVVWESIQSVKKEETIKYALPVPQFLPCMSLVCLPFISRILLCRTDVYLLFSLSCLANLCNMA